MVFWVRRGFSARGGEKGISSSVSRRSVVFGRGRCPICFGGNMVWRDRQLTRTGELIQDGGPPSLWPLTLGWGKTNTRCPFLVHGPGAVGKPTECWVVGGCPPAASARKAGRCQIDRWRCAPWPAGPRGMRERRTVIWLDNGALPERPMLTHSSLVGHTSRVGAAAQEAVGMK